MAGWAPREGEDRQRDHTRTNKRARRLRKTLTASEIRLRKLLKALNREGAHFRSQVAIADYVFDFGDLSRRIVIELDGGVHRLPDVVARDAAKTAWAENEGFFLLRISNAELFSGPDTVLLRIGRDCGFAPHPLTPAPPGGGGGV